MTTFHLTVVTPDGCAFDGQAERVVCRAIDGDLAILAKHGDYCTALGTVSYTHLADIAQERKKAVNEVKDEIGGIAMEIASKVVEREISEKDHKDLIDEFIKNVGEAS